jgi:HAD domain in Swiss Army Knife RNA repair proteins
MGWKTNRRVKRTQQKKRQPPDDRPVLFLDVDGVISLFGFHPSGPPPGTFHSIDGIIHCIGDDVAARLGRLADAFELVWATGWEEKANEYLVHILELPGDLPVLTFDGRAVFGSSHWKVEAIEDYARGRAAAWIDDNLDERVHEWAANREEPTLLVLTESALGITDEHVATLLSWAADVSPGGDRVSPD